MRNALAFAVLAFLQQSWTSPVNVESIVPSGGIIFLDSGACPPGWPEVTALNGRTVLGTVAANGNAGTTGGADSITPTGTIAWPAGVPTHSGTAATFSGNALGTHSHTTSGNCAATNIAAGTGSATACKATAPNLATNGVTAGTPAGTVNITNQGTVAWPAGVPTFSGAQADNRSAFVRLIACKKA